MAHHFQQGDDPPINGGFSVDGRRRGIANGKRPVVFQANIASSPAPPCGACKFLRRKCSTDCNFAPYFRSEQGAALFAAVHKVFGASNVSKHLNSLDPMHRQDAIFSICYEAQARLADPIHGCVATIMSLQQQVASLQAELSMVQAQLMNSRLALMNALQNMQNQQNPNVLHQNFGVLQPALSNNSSASNNIFDFSNLPSTTNVPVEAAPSSGFDPLQYSQLTPDDEAAQAEIDDPAAFADQILGKN